MELQVPLHSPLSLILCKVHHVTDLGYDRLHLKSVVISILVLVKLNKGKKKHIYHFDPFTLEIRINW